MASLENFELPQSVQVDEATATDRYAKFVTEPWQNGFGLTIGNALRRVLLSSIEGVAVTSVRIDGVSHEFCSIPGIKEDVMEVILNIKQLHFTCETSLPKTVELVFDKAGPVTAAEIQCGNTIEVLNPELLICTSDGENPLRMEFELNQGRSYRVAEDNKHDDLPIDAIPVDSLFNPIERVRYDVQSCRVGQHTDYDRLELEIWTDGRIDPRKALSQAIQILQEHLRVFASADGNASGGQQGTLLSDDEHELVNKLSISINDLELSVRAINCLNAQQIRYLGELVEKSESQMLKYRNFGKKSLQEVKEKLALYDLTLDMVIPEHIKEELMRQLALQLQVNNEE
jgi:DNA-directed RNA polymerase subunit alpha